VLRLPAVTSELVGASRWSQIEDSLGALKNLQFSAEELAEIDRHAVEGELNIWANSSNNG
jgi:L-glyceraldehyde 3-phosphate reductase